jgi:hypothetical protein
VTPPTPSEFLRLLEAELRLRGVAFELRDVLGFTEAVWPLAWHDPNPVRWADAFLEARAARA